MRQNLRQHTAVVRQARAEQTATAIRMQAAGATLRAIAEQLDVSKDTVMRMLRSAPVETVETAVADAAAAGRDRRAEALGRLDEIWSANAGSLGQPPNANVALRSVEIAARMAGLFPSPATVSSQRTRIIGMRVVNTVTGQIKSEVRYDHQQ